MDIPLTILQKIKSNGGLYIQSNFSWEEKNSKTMERECVIWIKDYYLC